MKKSELRQLIREELYDADKKLLRKILSFKASDSQYHHLSDLEVYELYIKHLRKKIQKIKNQMNDPRIGEFYRGNPVLEEEMILMDIDISITKQLIHKNVPLKLHALTPSYTFK